MDISVLQIILLTLLAVVLSYDLMNSQFLIYGIVVITGFISGLIMGDVETGLMVGGTLQLMTLGVGGYGGSSVPDYVTGTIIGTAFAVGSGAGLEAALAIGIPVATLAVQLDVLAKMGGSFFLHKSMNAVDNYNNSLAYRWIMAGFLARALAFGLPVLLALSLGQGVINSFIEWMPEWLINGFSVAGGLLPVVGISILLRYLPIKNYWFYALIGFFMAAYLQVPILGISIIGLVAAAMSFKNSTLKPQAEGGFDDEDE